MRGLTAVPRWIRILGLVSAVLVATGVVVPLGVDVASLTNFVGYLLWTAWLICLAAHLLIRSRVTARDGAVDDSDRVGSSEWGMA